MTQNEEQKYTHAEKEAHSRRESGVFCMGKQCIPTEKQTFSDRETNCFRPRNKLFLVGNAKQEP